MKNFLRLSVLVLSLVLILTGCNTSNPSNDNEAQTDKSWEYIKSNGKIIVGLDDTFAPMGFRDELGNIIGFDVDMAKAVAKELGLTIELQPIIWDAKEMELSDKKIDVIWNGMSKTPERAAAMTLSNPYLTNSIAILTKKGSDIKKKDDLAGKKVGVQAKSSALEIIEADEIYTKIQSDITEYQTYDEACMDLENGRVEAVIIDGILARYKMTQKPDAYALADDDFGEDLFVVGMRKEDKAFAQELQKAFDKLKENGEVAKISEKWFGEDLIVK